MNRVLFFRALATLAMAVLAALLWRQLRLPLPWMVGPLVVTAAASMLGVPTQGSPRVRNGAQCVIGTSLGLYFTPAVGALVMQLWWVLVLAVLWALALGWLCATGLERVLGDRLGGSADEQRATSWFAAAVGGASEMTLLAEREGGRTDLVAAAHSVRTLMVTVVVPFAFSWGGWHGNAPAFSRLGQVDPAGLAILMAATVGGSWLLSRLRGANPWFIGALVVAMALSLCGVRLSAMPAWASSAAQLVIGVNLGVRFRKEFVRTAPAWLLTAGAATFCMLALCSAFGMLLALVSGLDAPTLVLALAPGGMAEMAITAGVLHLGVPVVTSFQVCRLVAVLLVVGPLFRWMQRRR